MNDRHTNQENDGKQKGQPQLESLLPYLRYLQSSSAWFHRAATFEDQQTNTKHKEMGNRVSLEDEMINLRIVSKQMQRSAKKCEKNEKAALDKLKKVR